MVLQQRVFWREIGSSLSSADAINAVTTDTNTFLTTLLPPHRVRDITTALYPRKKYGEGAVFMTTVVFLE